MQWVAESKRPFNIVSDCGFQNLIKTGRPECYIPLPATVSHDVKKVFANAQKHIAKMLQEHEGALSFTTDAWMPPNHKAFVAVTVHFEKKWDVIEVAISHSGINLTAAFADILDEFGVSDRVSLSKTLERKSLPIISTI